MQQTLRTLTMLIVTGVQLALPASAQTLAPDSAERLRLHSQLEAQLDAAIAEGAFPGAVLWIEDPGQPPLVLARGRHNYSERGRRVRESDRFDLASLTKVCATTPLVLRLAEAGSIDLRAPIVRHLPEVAGAKTLTPRHLLAHCAGLPPFLRFYARAAEGPGLFEDVLATPLKTAPGERMVYSDIGMMWLAVLSQRAGQAPFEALVQQHVFQPLGMAGATFSTAKAPVDSLPTEQCEWRGRMVVGAVHDENAAALGGISGHAGLFGTAEDVARLGRAFTRFQSPALLSPSSVEAATAPAGLIPGSSRALGFATYGPDQFGHTGYTGTLLRVRKSDGRVVVFLTNRVHPTRNNRKISRIRRQVLRTVGL